ncbi:MAG: hypothetical protein DRP45_00985, partial [Candidatus Zixiibacteriota bacterium]
MSQRSDCRYQALLSLTGETTGNVNELMLQWLQGEGATSNTLADAWLEYLASEGFTGDRNTATFNWLRDKGYTGALPDMLYKMWCVDGGPATVWYVAATGTNGDGLTGETPWVGFSNIDWASIEPGHILDGMGDTYADAFEVAVSGDATGNVTIRNFNMVTAADDAVLTRSLGVHYDYLTFKDVNVVAAVRTGIYITAANVTDEKHVLVHDCEISGISGHAHSYGMRIVGRNVVVNRTAIHDVGEDGIYATGNGLSVLDSHIYNVSQAAAGRGDCIQIATESEGYTITGNTLDLRGGTNPKQCVVARVSQTGARGLVARNRCYAQNNADTVNTKSQCLYLANADVYDNECSGGTFSNWYED